MRVYWRYTCDFGHEWTHFIEEAAEEKPEWLHCPEGHEAVTLQKERPVDEVQITIRPAGRVVDDVKGQIGLAGRYWLTISSLQNHGELQSNGTYTWREVLHLIERFHRRTWEQAKDTLDELPPSSKL